MSEQQHLIQAIEQLKKLKLKECFDPINLSSRPNEIQTNFLKDINTYKLRLLRAGGQSGKSQTAAREIAWIVTDSHPYWTRPAAWGDEPLFILIAGQDRKVMELELWEKKLKPFLEAGDWREVRSGNALQHVKHKTKGHTIAFLSHSDSSESNRKHMAGYVSHYVWQDELSDNISIIEELQRRVVARDGWFTLTFTPKGKAGNIRNWADTIAPPSGMVYRMSQLDNPLYASRIDAVKARVAGMPEGMRNTVLYGDWEVGDNAVYDFDKATMVERPKDHSASWRHVEASDPAVSSKFGLTIWAEDPSNHVWYCIKSDYIKDIMAPDDIVKEVMKKTERYNIFRRVVDPHESWYIGMANKMGLIYMWPRNKNERKAELIKGLQQALSDGRVKIAPWCEDLIAELQSAQWADTEGKARIVGGKRLHLSDSAQYFVDCMPASEDLPLTVSWEQALRDGNRERKKLKALAENCKIGRKKWVLGKHGIRRLS